MKGYEIVYIMDPNTTDEGQQEIIDRVKGIFSSNGGGVIHESNWGRRKLAYPVQRFDYGIYQLLYTDRIKEALTELENQFRFAPEVIKWQTIAVDDVDHEFSVFERLKTEGSVAQNISDRGR